MSTWTCRLAILGLTALLLAGCDEATGLPFAAELEAIAEGPDRARMAEVALAGGDIVLSAPDGYCFDRRSVRRGKTGFAVMARCDRLGVRGSYGGHDLAIVTLTAGPGTDKVQVPGAAEIARSAGGARVLDTARADGVSLALLASGPQSLDGVSQTHWRGAFVVGAHLVGVSLYAPEGGNALSRDGARLLTRLSAKSRSASAAARKARAQAALKE